MPNSRAPWGLLPSNVAVALLLGLHASVVAQTLYNGSLGALPDAQGWSYAAFGIATQTAADGAVSLDTTAVTTTQAGYLRLAPVSLDRTNGFSLLFTAQLSAETHNNTNRAGFSVIVLGADKRGIELGFWTTRVFAQSDSPLFTQAEDASIVAASGFTDYALTLLATNYVLRANGTPVLSGPIRDYTAFNGFPDPYETPNLLFLGDDTTSASARLSLRQIVLVSAPRLTALGAGVIFWTGVSNQTYRVQASTDLAQWTTVASVSSTTDNFSFTNSEPASLRFFRVRHP